jgi:hypothetical protein
VAQSLNLKEAADLRRDFVEDVKAADQASETYGVLVVTRAHAQKAFSNWTYHQIIDWATENGLAVDFGREGVLNLFDVRVLATDAAALKNT